MVQIGRKGFLDSFFLFRITPLSAQTPHWGSFHLPLVWAPGLPRWVSPGWGPVICCPLLPPADPWLRSTFSHLILEHRPLSWLHPPQMSVMVGLLWNWLQDSVSPRKWANSLCWPGFPAGLAPVLSSLSLSYSQIWALCHTAPAMAPNALYGEDWTGTVILNSRLFSASLVGSFRKSSRPQEGPAACFLEPIYPFPLSYQSKAGRAPTGRSRAPA